MTRRKTRRVSQWFKRFRHKYRLVIMQDDTFEERLSFRLSRLNVFALISFIALLLISSTIYLIAYTPLKQYIPGYSNVEIREELYEHIKRTDSLERVVTAREVYLESIRNILQGNTDFLRDTGAVFPDPEGGSGYRDIEFSRSREDSLLRQEIQELERYSLIYYDQDGQRPMHHNPSSIGNFFFFTPMHGRITNGFNPDADHYGVDIAGKENETVKATLDGRVIFANWTSQTGYVIALMHQRNLVSVYKHNSALLKQQGENVKAGDPIAISGNTGSLTTGPHLHFELWHNGNPLNPREYINF